MVTESGRIPKYGVNRMKSLIVQLAFILSVISQIACIGGSKNIALERKIDLQSVDLTEYAQADFLVTPHDDLSFSYQSQLW